jgi:hypothetical protein
LQRVSSSERLARKLKEFRKKMKDTPMVKLKDKIAFVVGIFLVMATEAVLLTRPEWMPKFYMIVLLPLLVTRFFMYHKQKFHYFMLDFCYFCQLVTFTSLFLFPENLTLFKIMFALNNGPLAIAVIAWKNSLVFHDIDKITSLYIHIAPPLVTFCARWYPATKSLFADPYMAPAMTWKETYIAPVIFYMFWQICYILKTEVIDRKKLSADSDIMTSSRWLSRAKPHGIYLWLKKKGINLPIFVMLAGVQFFYTHLTLFPIPIFWNHFWIHAAYLMIVFISAAWTGATYYFEVFSEIYSARLKKRFEAATNTTEEQKEKEEKKKGKYAPTCGSIVSFSVFLGVCAICYIYLVRFFAL